MLTPFLFTTLLGHISVLFCSLCQQMFYTFFCLSVMSPSPSTSKCISPPGTQFRLTAPHISSGPNPAAFFQLNPGFTSTTAWIFWGFQWMKESAYLSEFDASPCKGGKQETAFWKHSNYMLFGYVDLFGWFFLQKLFLPLCADCQKTIIIKDWSRQDLDILWLKWCGFLSPFLCLKCEGEIKICDQVKSVPNRD